MSRGTPSPSPRAVRRRLLLVLSAAVPLGLAGTVVAIAPAHAAGVTTVSFAGNVLTITGDAAGNAVGPGGTYVDFGISLAETGGGSLVAGAGCVQQGASEVYCGTYNTATTVMVSLGAGDDSYKWVQDPAQTVIGAEGNDTIETGNGKDTIDGGPGNDDLSGGRGDDILRGGDGADVVDGWDGNDSLDGGTGADTLRGDGATVYAGGNDTINARDSEADTVSCESGADTVLGDKVDVVAADCESVDTGPVTPGPGPGPVAPAVSVLKVKTPPLRRFAKGTPVKVTVTSDAACGVGVGIAVSAKQAKALGLAKKSVLISKVASGSVASGGSVTLKVRIAGKARAALKGATKVRAVAVVACVNDAGQGEASRKVVLKR